MLASGIKGMRIQLGFGSEFPGSAFMRRRLGCPVCLQRGALPTFHSCPEFLKIPDFGNYSRCGSESHSGNRHCDFQIILPFRDEILDLLID